jgi:uncharacterized protein (DUF488 family)
MSSTSDYKLYTIGYEGKDVGEFIKALKKEKIKYIIDVREQPLSRKSGFSKKALAKLLEQEKINYIHLKELGSPKNIRDKFKEDHDDRVFFEKYSQYLDSQLEAVEVAYNYLLKGTCCLMCFERLHIECHRKVVADKIKERDGNGLLIYHI